MVATEMELFSRVHKLAEALSAGACEIVIASVSRFHYAFEDLKRRFPEPIRSSIVGTTGEVPAGKYAKHRAILDYLSRRPETSWRALDGSFLEFPSNCREQVILCDPRIGLDDPQVHELRRWLRS